MFKGAMVALVTPFSGKGGSASGGKNLVVDEKKLKEIVEFQIKNGTSAIVPCGTTGESATLSYEEHERVIELVIKTVNKRVPVIAGTGSNNKKKKKKKTKNKKK